MDNIAISSETALPTKKTKTVTKKGRRLLRFSIDKRQKFVISVFLLTLGLILTESQFGESGVYIAVALSVMTDIFVWWSMRRDLTERQMYAIFILPFLYSLSFGLFYFLVPGRIIFRLLLALLYAFGLYSLLLSQNIFIVASIRTIALLSGARIVSFVITLISCFFLINTIFSLHLFIAWTGVLVFMAIYLLGYHSIWTYTLGKYAYPIGRWTLAITMCVLESAAMLWFWPSSPTVIALFLTGFFYTLTGLSHVWFDKRLFRNILWEYVWVGVIVFFVLNAFTHWGT